MIEESKKKEEVDYDVTIKGFRMLDLFKYKCFGCWKVW